MPSHRTHSITTLLAVAGAAALIALVMNRQVMQAQPRRTGTRPGNDAPREDGAAGGAPAAGLAAISPAVAADAGNAGGDFVRPAGPEAMRDAPRRGWDMTDEASDESFPASDPPGTY